ncbi:hypothetical protein TNCV_333141 [Trichonephila clavipes]|nr:hypothetical protein TNCV_333141 [Trichonephila clavipes]
MAKFFSPGVPVESFSFDFRSPLSDGFLNIHHSRRKLADNNFVNRSLLVQVRFVEWLFYWFQSVPGVSFSNFLPWARREGVCCHQISELDCPLVPRDWEAFHLGLDW